MEDVNKKIDLSKSDLKSIAGRLHYIKERFQKYNDFLCRSSDSVWEYPNADEKYNTYLELIDENENRLNKVEKALQITEDLTNILDSLKS